MAYIGKSPTGTGVRSRYYYTATGGETSLSGADDNSNTLVFSDGNYVDVSLNGIALVAGTDYNTSTANTIGGLSALSASDIVEVVVYDIFTVADTVSAKDGGTFSGNVAMGGTLSVTGASTLTGAATATGGLNVGTIKEATGTTTAMTIDSSGVITQPNKPMFAATGVSNTALASATWTKASFNSETFDVGGYYDPTTNYRYTPLVAGKYFFTAQAYITYNSGTGPTIIGISFYKNGSRVLQILDISGTTNYGMVNVSGIFDMNGSTDYLETYVYQSAATNAVYYVDGINGIFTGYLIG